MLVRGNSAEGEGLRGREIKWRRGENGVGCGSALSLTGSNTRECNMMTGPGTKGKYVVV